MQAEFNFIVTKPSSPKTLKTNGNCLKNLQAARIFIKLYAILL